MLYYAANGQKIANKKKVDYQEGSEKSRADSAAEAVIAIQKTRRKAVHEAAKITWRIRKRLSRADSAARSHKSYKKDLEKRRDDNAAQSRET